MRGKVRIQGKRVQIRGGGARALVKEVRIREKEARIREKEVQIREKEVQIREKEVAVRGVGAAVPDRIGDAAIATATRLTGHSGALQKKRMLLRTTFEHTFAPHDPKSDPQELQSAHTK